MALLSAITHSALSESSLQIFRNNNIHNVMDLLAETTERLAHLTKAPYGEMLDLRLFIIDKFKAPMISASDKIAAGFATLSTNIIELDRALCGGLPLGKIIEINGSPGCGKTQLAHWLISNIASVPNQQAIYVDTKNDFSAIRVYQILQKSGYSDKDIQVIMSKIRIVKLWNMIEIIHFFHELKLENKCNGVKLIIIDSLPTLMLQHQGEKNKDGLGLLNNLVNVMLYLAKQSNMAIIIINLLTNWGEYGEEDGVTTWVEKKTATLGKYWQHIPSLFLIPKLCNKNKHHSVTLEIKLAYRNEIRKIELDML